MIDLLGEHEDRPMTPAEFGEAFTHAMTFRSGPVGVPSGWIDVLFPTDCMGLVPADVVINDESKDLVAFVLTSCGVETSLIDAAWEWYLEQPRQGDADS